MFNFNNATAGHTADNLEVLRQIRAAWEQTLRAFGHTVDVEPLLLSFDPKSELIWLNYGTPILDADRGLLAKAVDQSRSEFERRGRAIRFEWFEALAPEFERVLIDAGLKLQARLPAMACTKAELAPPAAVSNLRAVMLDLGSDDQMFEAFFRVRNAAFGPMSEAPLADQIAEQRREIAGGNVRSALVLRDGEPAGVASLIGRRGGKIAELVGVGTAPEHRGNGVARAATDALARRHLLDEAGSAVWLSAGDDIARNVYERIRFRFIGWQLNYIDGRFDTT